MSDAKAKAAPCCKRWEDAQQSRADNQGYGWPVYVAVDCEATQGEMLAAVRFCPWCGAPKTREAQAHG